MLPWIPEDSRPKGSQRSQFFWEKTVGCCWVHSIVSGSVWQPASKVRKSCSKVSKWAVADHRRWSNETPAAHRTNLQVRFWKLLTHSEPVPPPIRGAVQGLEGKSTRNQRPETSGSIRYKKSWIGRPDPHLLFSTDDRSRCRTSFWPLDIASSHDVRWKKRQRANDGWMVSAGNSADFTLW